MNLETCTCKELQQLKDYLTWLQRYGVDIQKGLQQIAKAIELKEWERFVTVTRLLSLIENHGDSDGGLDDIVHDTAASTASDINNSGLERQLNWLLDQGCAPGFILERLGIKAPDLEEPDNPIGSEYRS
jgi:hypothetical protein